MERYNKHYIEVDGLGRIVNGWSAAIFPDRDTSDAICINEQGGYQFRLFPDRNEHVFLFECDRMVPLYKWDGQNVVKRAQAEIDADIAALPVPEAPAGNGITWNVLAAAIREGVNSV